jgi:hypothetical protein
VSAPPPQDLRIRATIALYIAGFCLGFLSHANDFLTHGWFPYQWGIPVLDAFWTSLILLDLAVVALLLAGYRRIGLLAALTVMTCDVAANTYALFVMQIHGFANGLVMQAAFFGYVAGTIAFTWPARDETVKGF